MRGLFESIAQLLQLIHSLESPPFISEAIWKRLSEVRKYSLARGVRVSQDRRSIAQNNCIRHVEEASAHSTSSLLILALHTGQVRSRESHSSMHTSQKMCVQAVSCAKRISKDAINASTNHNRFVKLGKAHGALIAVLAGLFT